MLKAKHQEEKYQDKIEFPGGQGGVKQKTFCVGSTDISGTVRCVLRNYMFLK